MDQLKPLAPRMATEDSEDLASTKRREVLRYLELFASAFDELHAAVVEQAKVPGQYIGPHHD